MQPTAVNQLIRNRRAIYPKNYNDLPIPDAIVQEILENANWAPTHRRTEPWRFVVFKGAALDRLGGFLAELYKKTTPKDDFKEAKYQKNLHKPAKCSHVIAIVMQRDPEKRVPEIEETNAVACAVQNMWLSASAYRIGAYWSTPKMLNRLETHRFLELEEGQRCLGLFYMGYHDLPQFAGRRNPIEEKVRWIEE